MQEKGNENGDVKRKHTIAFVECTCDRDKVFESPIQIGTSFI
jgi:hypothetical protein